jgi:hypothetical protein
MQNWMPAFAGMTIGAVFIVPETVGALISATYSSFPPSLSV